MTSNQSSNHASYHYSITCKTTDEAVLHCLRALAQYVEHAQYPQIGWGGTTKQSWLHNNHEFTVRFTNPAYRTQFVQEAQRVLGKSCWSQVATSNNDPAVPRR